MLLEVMIAFLIAALALGVVTQAVLTELRSSLVTSRYEQALSHARSRLVIARHGSPLTPEDLRGDDGGGFRWRLLVTPIASTPVRPFGSGGSRQAPDFTITLYALTVWIVWFDAGAQRSVRLDTEQIGQQAR